MILDNLSKEIDDLEGFSKIKEITELLFQNIIEIESLHQSKFLSKQSLDYLFKSKKENKKKNFDKEIPSGVIIGGMEFVSGVLLWVTPFKKVGVGLIVDGIRRMLNETEQIAKENEQKQSNK